MTSSPRSAAGAPQPTHAHPAHALLSRAHSPDTASRIFGEKVRNKPLLLQPTSSADRDQRALRRRVRLRKKEYYLRKRQPKPLSAREKRALGLVTLKKEDGEVRYEIYRGLHELWTGYMLEVLGYVKDGQVVQSSLARVVTAQSHGALLASADFHGAELEVVGSSDTGKVGIKGIVVRDTKYTFVVVTAKDEVKTLPKKNSVFRYEIPLPEDGSAAQNDGPHHGDNNDKTGTEATRRLVFELHGTQFAFRPAERANRKFKWKATDYL